MNLVIDSVHGEVSCIAIPRVSVPIVTTIPHVTSVVSVYSPSYTCDTGPEFVIVGWVSGATPGTVSTGKPSPGSSVDYSL